MRSARDEIEAVVEERARRDSLDEVASLRSDGHAEQTVRSEYHGRFLIELLQNARDAAMKAAAGEGAGSCGRLRIELGKGCLVVANQGVAVTPKVLLYSLGKFGESTKPHGEGIGHKGIGFKSVLEVTLTPELYSREAPEGPFDLAVRFDPERAVELVRARSQNLSALVEELPAESVDDPVATVPVLAFPQWADEPVSGWEGFNTVVRLVHDRRFDGLLGLDAGEWQRRAASAVEALSDQIVVLLAVFDRIEIAVEGQAEQVIERRVLAYDGGEVGVSDVEVARGGVLSSRWRLYERSLVGHEGLSGDLAVGVRLEKRAGRLCPTLPWVDGSGDGGGCFHLFFPTEIRTGLPFLLHAYFEVNASRTRFARDAEAHNRALLLDGLEVLVADAVAALVGDPAVDPVGLAGLFAAADGEVGDGLAGEFRQRVLARLDDLSWVAADDPDAPAGSVSLTAPRGLLVDHRAQVAAWLPVAFPPTYLNRLGASMRHPHPEIGAEGRGFLARRANPAGEAEDGVRQEPGAVGVEVLGRLLRPGPVPIWADGKEAEGFVALCRLLGFLLATDPDGAGELVDGLRGDPKAQVVPVVGGADRETACVAPPAAGVDEPTGAQAVFARLRDRGGVELVPPAGLGLEFVPDGTLDRDLLASPGGRLGIREYTTNAVLDRLAAASDQRRAPAEDEASATAVFVWRLLARERDSRFGLRQTLFDAVDAAPGAWFWCEPGRARNDDGRADQRRARALAHLRLPAADGSWQPATALAFGGDWADWLDGQPSEHAAERAQRYRRLEAVAPDRSAVVAGPDTLTGLFALDPGELSWLAEEEAPPLGDRAAADDEVDPTVTHRWLVHAFLLRLGVWEIPPLEATVDYRSRGPGEVDPWPDGPDRADQLAVDGVTFGVKYPHDPDRVHVAEDYRLRWPLDTSGDPGHLAALADGAGCYRRYQRLRRFCPGCSNNHKNTYHDDTGAVPSSLRWALARSAWVPVIRHGEPAGFCRPGEAWWRADPPTGTAARQSPYRYLALATGVPEPLRHLADIPSIDNAGPDRLMNLLDELRRLLEDGAHPGPGDGPAERQAFIGLHRLIYRRLVALDAPAPAEVLAEDGTALIHAPPALCRFDDGRHAGHRRHFVGRLAFAALSRDQEAVAGRFAIPRFRLNVNRRDGGDERDDTPAARLLLHDRIDEMMAVLVFHSLGGPTLDLGSDAFRERATRLTQLQVRHVDDLVLDLAVVGADPPVTVAVGEGSARDLHVEGVTTAHPVLYHDLPGDDWLDQLRRHVAPHLAELVENPAYAATFALLLQHDDPDERQAWLLDLGIGDIELEQVRDALATAGLVARAEHRRWWQALLPMLGAAAELPEDGDPNEAAAAALATAGVEDNLCRVLVAAGGGSDVRRDTSPEGALAALEGRIDLEALDRGLRGAGDAGLRIDSAAGLLREWTAQYGRLVAAILTNGRQPLDPDDARARSRRWLAPPATKWLTQPDAALVLDVVAVELQEAVGADVDAAHLAGPDPAGYLAELARTVGIDDLAAAAEDLDAGDGGQRQRREAALAWRNALIPRLTALTVAVNVPPYAIRARAESVASDLPANPAGPDDLTAGIEALAASHSELIEALRSRLAGHSARLLPAAADLDTLFAGYIKEAHLHRVIEILRAGSRQRIDNLRARTTQLADWDLVPTPLQPDPVADERKKTPRSGPRGPIERRHVKRDPRRLKQIGDEGEAWALAAVMGPLLAMDQPAIEDALSGLSGALEAAYKGDCIDELRSKADHAASPWVDDDDRAEALAEFLHLSRTSDMFGCDLLGWLRPDPDDDPKPLFLEVKSSLGRQALISTHEWDEATRLGDRYAILVVTRDRSGDPTGMDLLVDPVALHHEQRLIRTADGYVVTYGVSAG